MIDPDRLSKVIDDMSRLKGKLQECGVCSGADAAEIAGGLRDLAVVVAGLVVEALKR